jgi:hypothetical protein
VDECQTDQAACHFLTALEGFQQLIFFEEEEANIPA